MKISSSILSLSTLFGALLLAGSGCQTIAETEKDSVLLQADFRDPDLRQESHPSWDFLPNRLPGTGIRPTPHREDQGLSQALVRSLQEAPLWPDGSLQITRNEVEQGIHRTFPEAVPFDPQEEILLMRTTTFADATTGGTNSIAVRLWVQSGFGPNEHRERMELSTHFNHHPRGARQVYPNAYVVRDGWETWAMPEGTNGRRAGVYYLLGAEPRNDEIRSRQAVRQGFYWTWEGLRWPTGWESPLGGALYAPPSSPDQPFQGDGLYTTTAVFRQSDQPLPGFPHEYATSVDLIAPRTEGRITLESPLPRRIDEVRLILRSEKPSGDREWIRPEQDTELDDPLLGVVEVQAQILSRADANMDGQVDLNDWDVLWRHQNRENALHHHGDLTGDGRVGLADAFYLAARLPQSEQRSRVALEEWRAWVDAESQIHLQIPGNAKVYGWKVISAENPLPKANLESLLGELALTEINRDSLGEADLRNPYQNNRKKPLQVMLGSFSAGEDRGNFLVKIQADSGVPAITLPLEESSSD